MADKKNQHFVPKFYLRKFQSCEKEPLYVFNLENMKRGYSAKIKPSFPAAICYKEYYYNIDRDLPISVGKRPKQYIENNVNGFYENKIPKIIEKIISESALSLREATLFSDFIIHLKVRNPYQELLNERSKIQRLTEISSKRYDFFRNEAFERGIPKDIFDVVYQKSIKSLLNKENLTQELQKESLIRKYENPEENYKKFRDAIVSSSWKLLELDDNSDFFLTTDNPGVALDSKGIIHNTKFLNGFNFYLPLSPKHSLRITDMELNIIENDIFLIEREKIDSSVVKDINKLSSSVSNNLIISNSKDNLQRFLDQNFAKENGI
ncbi:DUF4238 domain-containing protein [Aquiflexum lacus]|uniref:DUF4238 domain-containing protein n=1 Tax=Aquiflexum lacus TaxID=2483805 RepID=UPI0018952B7D|nr:DUF4238 domain-containing protein [Aquiflexum lacus]